MITQEFLKNFLHYDPLTGIFRYTRTVNSRAIAGSIAGNFDGRYRHIRINKKSYAEHRLAWLYMTGQWPKDQVDHINLIKSDNR